MADCLAAVVHHVEEGWRKGQGSQGMFQIGLVEKPGQPVEPDPLLQQAVTKVAHGAPLFLAEEDRLVLGDLDKL